MTHRDLDSASIASAPVDQSKRRPDTHPELRTGLWQFTYRNTQSLVETTTVPAAEVGQAADTTALLASSPEVLNAVGATGVAESRTSISEAAGAAPESTVIIDTKPGTKVEIK